MKLYNSVTKQVDDFTPIAPPTVSLYVCGVTVYDYCHLGHARAYVAFDLLKRVLTHHGYTVIHVQNVTDIDDKIIARANDQGEDINALTHRFMAACREDLDALNILPPNYMPKATTHVPDMIQLIQQLIQNGSAYVVGQSVYFRIASNNDYGTLSHKTLDDLQAGHRIDVDDQKESPLDFVLWKPAKSENHLGNRHGDMVDQDGIRSVSPWLTQF